MDREEIESVIKSNTEASWQTNRIIEALDKYEKALTGHNTNNAIKKVDDSNNNIKSIINDFIETAKKAYENYDIDCVLETSTDYSYTTASLMLEEYIDDIGQILLEKYECKEDEKTSIGIDKYRNNLYEGDYCTYRCCVPSYGEYEFIGKIVYDESSYGYAFENVEARKVEKIYRNNSYFPMFDTPIGEKLGAVEPYICEYAPMFMMSVADIDSIQKIPDFIKENDTLEIKDVERQETQELETEINFNINIYISNKFNNFDIKEEVLDRLEETEYTELLDEIEYLDENLYNNIENIILNSDISKYIKVDNNIKFDKNETNEWGCGIVYLVKVEFDLKNLIKENNILQKAQEELEETNDNMEIE